MSKFLNNTTQTVSWFKKASDDGDLEMKPPFQRNPVWTTPQKRYLIDSILHGFPIPEIYMQRIVDDGGREKHTIIDGQQRIRACLEFIEGRFALDPEESPSWGDMFFDDLPPDAKKLIFSYIFVIRILPEMPDGDIRGIFQRLNKNVVALNRQELRHATYWGAFLKTIQEIADYPFWSSAGVFTPHNIRRMMDAEYISELAIAVLNGHQNKKETVDSYYAQYEEEFDRRDELLQIFQTVLLEIEQLFPDIKRTRWRKKTDFYSLFVYLASQTGKLPLSKEGRHNLRATLSKFAASVDAWLAVDGAGEPDDGNVQDYAKSIRASSDLANRKRRHHALATVLNDIFEDEEDAVVEITPRASEDLFNARDESDED